MTYAEASVRKNGAIGNSDAKAKIDELRTRAHAPVKSTYTLDDICDEWSREFWLEGRRRVDLIRFGKFADSPAISGNGWEEFMRVINSPLI